MRLLGFTVFALAIATSSAIPKQYLDSAVIHSHENKRAGIISSPHGVLSGGGKSADEVGSIGIVRDDVQVRSNARSNNNQQRESDPRKPNLGLLPGVTNLSKGAIGIGNVERGVVLDNHSNPGSHFHRLQVAGRRVQRHRFTYGKDHTGKRRRRGRRQKRRRRRRSNWLHNRGAKQEGDSDESVEQLDSDECSETGDGKCTEGDPNQLEEAGRGVKRKHSNGVRHRQGAGSRKCRYGGKPGTRNKCRRLRRKCNMSKKGKCLRRSITRKSEKKGFQKHDLPTDGGNKEGLEVDERKMDVYEVEADDTHPKTTHSFHHAANQHKKQRFINNRSLLIKRIYGKGSYAASRKLGIVGQETANNPVKLQRPSNAKGNPYKLQEASRRVRRRRTYRCRPGVNRKCRRRRRRRRTHIKPRKNPPKHGKKGKPSDFEGSTDEELFEGDEILEDEYVDVTDHPKAHLPSKSPPTPSREASK